MSHKLTWVTWSCAILALIAPALALEHSTGRDGINAQRLHHSPYNLIGRKIAIGQVEIGRPGKFGLDKVVPSYSNLNLGGVFYRDDHAKSNVHVDNHAAMVASVMVSQDKSLPGVAPGARLYASAVGNLQGDGQVQECLASQYIAEQNGGDLRAINFSFGESLSQDSREDAKLDGNALLTQCIDWSSRVHDVLYVIAGNQGRGGIPIPTDHYNGITTAYTTRRDGQFIKVDFANLSSHPEGSGSRLIQQEINVGPRRAVSLVAPGSNISLYGLDGQVYQVSGTSFAAPHITASVALLQEFGDRQLFTSQPNWSLDSRRHEVMKVVLLNSANKIEGILGMTRTIFGKNNQTWLESDAYFHETVSLDIEMGTGHLDVFRAYQQFSAGQWSYQDPIPTQGWDYNQVEINSHQDYILEKPLQQGSFISITLAWDRLVELNDTNDNQQYDPGETFRDRGLNNLDLYLIPVDSNNTSTSVCSSVSSADSVEHIFCPIPADGRYKIRVEFNYQRNHNSQPYALAWWTN